MCALTNFITHTPTVENVEITYNTEVCIYTLVLVLSTFDNTSISLHFTCKQDSK